MVKNLPANAGDMGSVCSFFVFLVYFSTLVIIGGLVIWFGCSLLSFVLFNSFKKIFNNYMLFF